MIKKYRFAIIIGVSLLCITLITALTRKVTYSYGINYNVFQKEIPLYVKLMEFICRDYHYQDIVLSIVGDEKDPHKIIDRLYHYIRENVKINKELPIVDDHPYHILVRGYGVEDQFEDIFTILCNYAGLPAYYQQVKLNYQTDIIQYCSFVKIDTEWTLVSVYHDLVFKDRDNRYLPIHEIKHQWHELAEAKIEIRPNFVRYKGQSLFSRITMELNKFFR